MTEPGSIVGTAIGREWKTLRPGEQSNRYLSLIRADPDAPSPCVTSIGGGRGVAGVTHPHEPRKYTIPELRIVCGFPADYELAGTYSDQWARLGNAVPPPMMYAVARRLRDGLFTRIGRTRAGFIDAVAPIPAAESPMTKPPFRIPSMEEVAKARGSAGLTVVSTFSGCGGSCLGFEMAGFKVLWANEFLPIARESYAANHPETILDGRDIRRVEASHILDAIGMRPGELDVFNGSPPCQAFSSAGQRDKGWGKSRDYGNGVSQKNEDLFFEYVRLLQGLQPRAFVAENVAGLTRGVALGYFKDIMRGLSGCGYAVRCKVLDAQWLGVPQTRARAIFIGVRNDLQFEPEFPKPLPYRYSLRDVLPGLSGLGNRGIGGWKNRDPYIMRKSSVDAPAMTITGTGTGTGTGDYRVIDRVVHDTAGNPSFSDGDVTDKPCPVILACRPQSYQVYERAVEDAERASPLTESKALQSWKSLPLGKFRKYKNLVRCHPEKPVPCIMAGAGAGAGSSAAVTPPNEPRRFSIGELRIVCGFPEDFELKGTYAERWARLGNAVPPLMMREVAAVLRDSLFAALGRTRAGFTEAR